jgi:H+/Cl- antiporter ClcA
LVAIILRYLKLITIIVLISALVGSSCSLFAYSLLWVTNFREHHDFIILGLPIAGVLMLWWYNKYLDYTVSLGMNSLLNFLQKKDTKISIFLAPSIFVSTLVSHLFGASVGREGTAVQMGGGIAGFFTKKLNFSDNEKRLLVRCGMAAGFSALFGTPFAAFIFSYEVVKLSQINLTGAFWVILCSYLSYFFYDFWHVSHGNDYIVQHFLPMSLENFLWILISGIFFSMGFWVFNLFCFFTKQGIKILKLNSYAAIVFVSLIILLITWIHGDYGFLGLGLETIKKSFYHVLGIEHFLLKALFTALCVSAGFKGGEVTPLFFMGATLGSFLSQLIPLPLDCLAAMGFISIFAAAAKTPIACIFMGIEIFGQNMFFPISVCCISAFYFSGKNGIYASQDNTLNSWI